MAEEEGVGESVCLSDCGTLSLSLKWRVNSSFHHGRQPPPFQPHTHMHTDKYVKPLQGGTMNWRKLGNVSQHAAPFTLIRVNVSLKKGFKQTH